MFKAGIIRIKSGLAMIRDFFFNNETTQETCDNLVSGIKARVEIEKRNSKKVNIEYDMDYIIFTLPNGKKIKFGNKQDPFTLAVEVFRELEFEVTMDGKVYTG